MKHRDIDAANSEFDIAWRALVTEDVKVTAPTHVEDAVMAEWSAARLRPVAPRPVWRFTRPRAAVAAAAVVLAALAVIARSGTTPPRSSLPAVRPPSLSIPEPRASAQPEPAVREEPVAVAPRAARVNAAPTAIMTLAVDPVLETESLQIVRVRMPRGALRALGIALVEPEARGLVDVDVLVGEDGLPRDIRRIRAVVDRQEEETIQ
jgi:hypothetical protein